MAETTLKRGLPSPTASPSGRRGAIALSDGAMALQLKEWLDDWHYRILHSSLARKWPRTQVLQAAFDILELNGVEFTDTERETFMQMEEGIMIQFLAGKLPHSFRDCFEHLTLQLKIVVTMTTRIRKALEENEPHLVEEVLQETDGSGIGQQVMKQAVIVASREVATLHQYEESWVENTERRMDRLFRSAELAEQASRNLMAVESQLAAFEGTQKERNQTVLMGLVQNNAKALQGSIFSAWLGIMLKVQAEKEIREKFETQIQEAEDALVEAKKKKLAGVTGAMTRTAAEGDDGLLRVVWGAWALCMNVHKRDGDTIGRVKELERKMAETKDGCSGKARKFLAKMVGERTTTLLGHVMATWVSFHIDYNKDKAFEDQVKATEKLLQEHMSKKKDGAMSVMMRFTGESDSGLKSNAMKAWTQQIADAKRERFLADTMDSADGKFNSLVQRQRSTAKGIQSRVNEQMSTNLLCRTIAAWHMESKCQHIEKYYSTKMESKRRQLQSVQSLFKSFARQLEEGLGNIDGDSSARTRPKVDRGGEAVEDGGPATAETQHLIDANGIRAACEKHVGRAFKSWKAVTCTVKTVGSSAEFRVVVDISNGGKEQAIVKIHQGKGTRSGERGPPVVQGLELIGGRIGGMKESVSLPEIHQRVPVAAS
eukprot:TRINITY_DN74576_c0_g1_i1.p1 TRINITY_DN74576_c0_g1~~TRINITY_DN74576_c0_g1_i1.p1  ORF type:complete len:672 (+),score=148.75 TRINITY_DN74576_c0_g1_i1:49-2016(+)